MKTQNTLIIRMYISFMQGYMLDQLFHIILEVRTKLPLNHLFYITYMYDGYKKC